nr:tRNA(ile)-lysidine synthase, chloroplastic [Ipomoea batatas]
MAQTRTSLHFQLLSSLSKTSCKLSKFGNYNSVFYVRALCSCSSHHQANGTIELSNYKETFAKRMAMAGLKPHHRIALGVSGGPDSMALCVLAASWKTSSHDIGLIADKRSESIDGLLAIVVDHGLRSESKAEANLVQRRVTDMGIKCEIAHCEWPEGRPKQGHLQEAARNKRYEILQSVCIQHHMSVILIAHHADDQAELFILRLSRNSGVLGLAGMAFVSELFYKQPSSNLESFGHRRSVLVRPLLEFSKEDMYKICQAAHQEWVEDPTNRSQLFARNRIRMSLTNLSSSAFKSELQDLITTCRRTRLHVDRICSNLIHHAVIITPLGYAVVDLGLLNPSKVKDVILSKFISLILQFVSQRQRPIRGSALKLLLDYIRTFPCKTCLTAAGCYLSPAPGSKGTKMLVCCSPNADLPLKTELLDTSVNEVQNCYLSDVEQIITEAKLYADQFSQDGLGVQYLDLRPSDSLLVEAKRQGVISESTYWSIVSLQEKESENFRSQSDTILDFQFENEEPANDVTSRVLYEGKTGYFMNRFLVKWNLNKKMSCNLFSTKDTDLSGMENWNSCSSRVIGHDLLVEVRHMVDADWLYLAKLAESQNERLVPFPSGVDRKTGRISCSDYVKQSAERALLTLKSIPVAARRTLPVLVNSDGLLLSIPSIEFQHCPCLEASAVFKPMVPLGAGYTSFL